MSSNHEIEIISSVIENSESEVEDKSEIPELEDMEEKENSPLLVVKKTNQEMMHQPMYQYIEENNAVSEIFDIDLTMVSFFKYKFFQFI